MNDGFLITFEGIEGSGKTTQIRILEDELRLRGREVIATREPGGTRIGDKIRKVLLNPEHKHLAPEAELLLYAAARVQHVTELIRPALAAGKIVLCDRFTDATIAYQGGGRRLSLELIRTLHHLAVGALVPRLTVLLDCPVEIGIKRAKDRFLAKEGAERGDRIEQEEIAFHERVRESYLRLAKEEPHRFVLIDGTLDIDLTHQKILREVQRFL